MSSRALYVLATGEPLPVTRELRGSFGALIRGTAGEAFSGPWRDVDGRGADELPALDGMAGLIITGSAASVTSREPWMLRLEAYLRELAAAKTPLFGICFGHQLLAQALGGLVEKNPYGREIGSVTLERLGQHAFLENTGGEFLVNSTHVDAVTKVPPGARVLGRTALDPHAVLQFDERVFGVQFHPEVDAEVMLHYVNGRRHLLADEGLDVDAIRENVRDTPESAGILRRFASWLSELERA